MNDEDFKDIEGVKLEELTRLRNPEECDGDCCEFWKWCLANEWRIKPCAKKSKLEL